MWINSCVLSGGFLFARLVLFKFHLCHQRCLLFVQLAVEITEKSTKKAFKKRKKARKVIAVGLDNLNS